MRSRQRWDFDWHGDEIESELQRARTDILRESAEVLLDQAKENVPVRSGGLLRSGRVDATPNLAIVSFGMTGRDQYGRATRNYAIMQEVREDYTHKQGGKVYFMSAAFRNPGKAFSKMAEKIRAILRKG